MGCGSISSSNVRAGGLSSSTHTGTATFKMVRTVSDGSPSTCVSVFLGYTPTGVVTGVRMGMF